MEISTCVTIKDDCCESEGRQADAYPDFDPRWFMEPVCFGYGDVSGNYACEADIDEDGSFEELSPHELGREGERLASSYLCARGYTIRERNWRCREGEVDIICEDDEGTIVLVEVKSRQGRGNDANLMPELSVTEEKQHKLARLALWYLVENPMLHSVRFDVIAVTVTGRSSARIRHLVGAFTWDE